jgi:hypothetical protein
VTQAARRRGVVATAVALLVFLLGCTFCVGGLAKNEWHGDVPHYETFGAKVKDGQVPYHDFYLEYPPGALPVFVAPAVISERHYVKTFKLLMAALGAATIVGSALILALLDADYPRYGVALGTMALAPPLLGHVYLNRYDPWPALLVTFALLCLLVPRVRLAAGLLALAFTAKIYAAAALPVAALRIWRRRARQLLAAAGRSSSLPPSWCFHSLPSPSAGSASASTPSRRGRSRRKVSGRRSCSWQIDSAFTTRT